MIIAFFQSKLPRCFIYKNILNVTIFYKQIFLIADFSSNNRRGVNNY